MYFLYPSSAWRVNLDISLNTIVSPSWNKLENIIQKGDTIVFKEISRFTREAENGYKKYMELMQKGII